MKKNAKYSFTIGRDGPVIESTKNGIKNALSSLKSDRILAYLSTKQYNPVAQYVRLDEFNAGYGYDSVEMRINAPDGNIFIKNEKWGDI